MCRGVKPGSPVADASLGSSESRRAWLDLVHPDLRYPGTMRDISHISRLPGQVSDNVFSQSDAGWQYFFHREKPPYTITGKYLFFSADREALITIATRASEHGGFHQAKVIREGQQTGDYVLWLYFRDDSRKHELYRRYRNQPGIRYRYWKLDADTSSGKYSATFLDQLSPEARADFERGDCDEAEARLREEWEV